MEFKEYKLSDLTINGKGEYGIGASAVEYNPSLYRYLRITDIDDNGFINTDELKSVNDKNAENYLLKENEIVFARTGNSTGKSYFYNGEDGPLVFAGFLIRFKLDSKKVNPKFIRYYTLSENYKGWINQFATGSTRKNINAKTYGNMIIKLPPRSYQNYIVQILDSLEEKLKENKKIIANLEELSQTLFKRWFVDFEFPDENGNPYKSSGGEMIDSELGMVPKGWNFEKLKLLIENIKDNIRTKSLSQEDRYVPIDLIPKRKLTFYDYKSSNEAKSSLIKFKKNDILLGSMRVYFHRVSLAPFDGITRNTVFTLRPRDERYLYYLLNALNKDDFIQYAANNSKGSTMPYAVWDGILDEVTVLNPPIQYLIEFNSIVQKYFDISIILLKQNRQLEDLRDTLLPKLMSGEIEIPDDIEVNEDELSI